MERSLVLLLAGLSLTPAACHGGQTAQARMYCLSLRFQRGPDSFGLYSLDLTTIAPSVNGELAPYFGTYTHWSDFYLNDPTGYDPVPGTLGVNVPMSTDANGNGFPDFFEVERAVSATTSGAFNSPAGNGTLQATWSRAAGAKDGTCVLRLKLGGLGSLGDFTHPFELLEYKGPLSYTPGSNTVTGAIDLAQTGNPANTLQGPVAFVKSAANRFNLLTLQAGDWTNAALQILSFSTNRFDRDTPWPTNYYGHVDFLDGEPNTYETDYLAWMLSIDDPNDSDHDRIPDFSDDPVTAPARPPVLTLTYGATNLLLRISGDVGRPHQVQESTSLAATTWPTVLSVTLTNDPQVVTLPLPAGSPRFWRVQAQ